MKIIIVLALLAFISMVCNRTLHQSNTMHQSHISRGKKTESKMKPEYEVTILLNKSTRSGIKASFKTDIIQNPSKDDGSFLGWKFNVKDGDSIKDQNFKQIFAKVPNEKDQYILLYKQCTEEFIYKNPLVKSKFIKTAFLPTNTKNPMEVKIKFPKKLFAIVSIPETVLESLVGILNTKKIERINTILSIKGVINELSAIYISNYKNQDMLSKEENVAQKAFEVAKEEAVKARKAIDDLQNSVNKATNDFEDSKTKLSNLENELTGLAFTIKSKQDFLEKNTQILNEFSSKKNSAEHQIENLEKMIEQSKADFNSAFKTLERECPYSKTLVEDASKALFTSENPLQLSRVMSSIIA